MAAPPAHLANAEPTSVADSSQVSLTAHAFVAGEVFGPSLEAYSLRIAQGIGNGLELAICPVFGRIGNESSEIDNPDPYFGGGHGEVKGEFPWNSRWFVSSYRGGGGFLWSEAGKVVSGEVGLALGTRRGWLRPHIQGTLWQAFPFSTRSIAYSESAHDEDPEVMRKRLTSTSGLRGDAMLELVPVPRFSILCAVGAGLVQSRTDRITPYEFGTSIRIAF